MKKIWILSVAALLVGLLGFATNGFSEDKPVNMTNLQLSQLLVQKLSIELPAGSDKLAPAKYYTVLANALATKGITRFLSAKPEDFFSCADFADILYAVAGGKGKLDTKGKYDYLVKNGYMSVCPTNFNEQVTIQFANAIFNNAKLSGLIAETYTAPANPAANDRNPGANAPGVAHENIRTASPI